MQLKPRNYNNLKPKNMLDERMQIFKEKIITGVYKIKIIAGKIIKIMEKSVKFVSKTLIK